MSALVLLNPAARHRTGRARWSRVAGSVLGPLEAAVVETDLEGRWRRAIAAALASGVRTFVAAGGDGTVGALADAVVESRGSIALPDITLGAIGLGSSNDFHKPVRHARAGDEKRSSRRVSCVI